MYDAGKWVCKEIFWSKECDKSFNELKSKLCEARVLTFVDSSKDFILNTDASFGAIAAVLSQKEGNDEKVIAYASRTLSTFEKGYCVTRKELLALQEFMFHFK